jgi:pilus assembly protein CpaB
MRLIIMFIAIALAAGAFFITMHFTSNEPDKGIVVSQPTTVYKEVPTVDVYTAKEEIAIGAIIKPEMLDIQPWPKHLKLDDMVEANPNESSTLVKMVSRTPFSKGEPIMLSRLANEKDPNFLAAALPKGMRIVTIAVDQVSGVGGFVFPGDRVDVLITHDITLSQHVEIRADGTKIDPKKDAITEVLLSNIRVMAVNNKSAIKGGEPPLLPTNVSLEVTAADAQKIRLTENGNGRMSLALRALKDKEEIELARPSGVGDLSRLTPPAYFSVLYDNNGHANYVPRVVGTAGDRMPKMPGVPGMPGDTGEEDSQNEKSAITVVRGVKAEEVDVTRP